ncbi:MAG: hypothetical protein ACR2KQ_00935 [Actinomycetota bacterium]
MSDSAPPSISSDLDEILSLIGTSVFPVHDEADPVVDRRGGDVDCIVENVDQQWPLRLPRGWTLQQRLHYDVTGWMWTLRHPRGWLRIDALEDPLGVGRYGFPTHLALGGRALPASAARAVYLTSKRIRKRSTSSEDWQAITELAQRDRQTYEKATGRILGRKTGGRVTDAVLAGAMPSPAVLRRAARNQLLRRMSHPVRLAVLIAGGIRRAANRIAHPTGAYVVIVGPDGSGKSTLARSLPGACSELFRGSEHFHWRPGLLPRPGGLFGAPVDIDASVPHSRPPRGTVTSLVLLLYYWVDFRVGGITRVLWPRWRTGLVVGERGWWDFLVDPRRYRLKDAPRLVSLLGRLLPKPDLLVILEGPAEAMFARKSELSVEELERQSLRWRQIPAPAGDRLIVDTSQPPDRVVELVAERIASNVAERAAGMLGAGWTSLPGRGAPRWLIPRGPRAVTNAAFSIYQPVTPSARRKWRTLQLLATTGAFRWFPRGRPPGREVRELLAQHVPERGTIALARSNHPGRYLALVLGPSGAASAVAKIALDPAGRQALEREAAAIDGHADLLRPPLEAPQILARDDGLLLLTAVKWRHRRQPWVLPEEVASGLGSFFRAGAKEGEGGRLLGPCHGDCAPWNLLDSGSTWTLVDWEEFDPQAPAFFDLFHFIVQSYELLGRPARGEIQAGLRGEGWVGRAIDAYATAASIEPGEAGLLFPSFRDFLEDWRKRQPPSARPVRSLWR